MKPVKINAYFNDDTKPTSMWMNTAHVSSITECPPAYIVWLTSRNSSIRTDEEGFRAILESMDTNQA